MPRCLLCLNARSNLMGVNLWTIDKYSNPVLEWMMLKMTEVDCVVLPEASLIETYGGPANANAHWLGLPRGCRRSACGSLSALSSV